jgi:hypothetical protein
MRKKEGKSGFFDALGEILFWIPELLFLPFRLAWYLLRGLGKIIGDIFNF